VGARFSAPVQTGPEANPASCTMGTRSFPGGKKTTTHSKNRNITLGCAFEAKFRKIFTSLHQTGVKVGWMQAFPTHNIIFCFFLI